MIGPWGFALAIAVLLYGLLITTLAVWRWRARRIDDAATVAASSVTPLRRIAP